MKRKAIEAAGGVPERYVEDRRLSMTKSAPDIRRRSPRLVRRSGQTLFLQSFTIVADKVVGEGILIRTRRGFMGEPLYDSNCDLVVEMENMGVGVEEILQYAKGVFSRDEIRSLVQGLETMVAPPPCDEREESEAAFQVSAP